MYRRALIAASLAMLTFYVENPLSAQVLRPTPAPLVTAENEPWYLNGDPITYAGNIYYPAGAQVFFSPNEMVRSGFHLGVPLYTRTTQEPFSVVYLPLAGGRMQPYERPRSGELAGTSGSRPVSATTPYDAASEGGGALQAPAPPTQTASRPVLDQQAVGTAGTTAPSIGSGPVGAAGRAARPRPMHTRIGGRPSGINAVYVEFNGSRWLSSGRSEEIDPQRLERIGDYNGFDVWAERGSRDTIYLAVTPGATVAVPYSRDTRRTTKGSGK